MTDYVQAESTGAIVEAVAIQACLTVDVDIDGGRVGAATRYGVVYRSPVHGGESMVYRLFVTPADAAVEAAGYRVARIVRVLVEVTDV